MLFMSERQKDVGVRVYKDTYSPASGEKVGSRRRVFAEFRRGGVPAWALPLALERFGMAGKPPTVAPQRWLCYYDSAEDQHVRSWSDEERELIEAKLLSMRDVYLIEPPKVQAPYAMYDQHRKMSGRRTLEHVVKDIREAYEAAGFDVPQAVAYERQHLNDSAVVEALEGLVEKAEEPVEALIAG